MFAEILIKRYNIDVRSPILCLAISVITISTVYGFTAGQIAADQLVDEFLKGNSITFHELERYHLDYPLFDWLEYLEKSSMKNEDSVRVEFVLLLCKYQLRRSPEETLRLLKYAQTALTDHNNYLSARISLEQAYVLFDIHRYDHGLEILQDAILSIDTAKYPKLYQTYQDVISNAYNQTEHNAPYYKELLSKLVYEDSTIGGRINRNYAEVVKGMVIIENDQSQKEILMSKSDQAKQALKERLYREAITFQLEGLIWEKVLQDHVALSYSYTCLGSAYASLGEIDSMGYYYDLAIEMASITDTPKVWEYIYENQSISFETLGDINAAFIALKLKKKYAKIRSNRQFVSIRQEMIERFETDQKEAENKLLILENEKKENRLNQQNIFMVVGGLVLLLVVAVAIYIYHLNRITQKLNQKISAQSIELKQTNRTKDRLFSIIGHDLRGPITSFETVSVVINNYLKKKDFSKVEEVTRQVNQSARNLNLLLNNLLNWSLSQQQEITLYIQPTALKLVVEEVMDTYAEIAKNKNIIIRSEVTIEKALADYNTFSTIIRNLISNALKFSPMGSEITIIPKVSEQFVELIIKDQGIGIPEQSIEKLFTIDKSKVRKGTSKETGSGLGLVLVKEFVELNNGHVKLISKEGVGSAFSIILPIAS